MLERILYPIEELAEKNTRVMVNQKIDPEKTRLFFDVCQEAGTRYLESLYPGYEDNQPSLPNIDQFETEQKKTLLQSILIHDVQIVLIRPEMFHYRQIIYQFLTERDFKVVYDDVRVVDAIQYALIYKHVFGIPEARSALPTRTMTFINSPNLLVVFTDPKKRYGGTFESLADGFFKQHKGREGVHQQNTLRGEIIYQEAVRLGFDTLSDFIIALATDPMYAYRHIITQPGDHYHTYIKADKPLMAYNAQGVHIPNSTELPKDLLVLNTVDQLNDIYEALRNN